MTYRVSLGFEVSGPDLARQARGLPALGVSIIEAGMAGVAEGHKLDQRQHIGRAFPNAPRLPTTLTGKMFPAGPGGLPPAALLYPRKDSYLGPMLASHTGTTILPKHGPYLAIPMPAVPQTGDGRTRQMTPRQYVRAFGEKSLFFVRARSGKAAGYLMKKLKAGVDYPKKAQRGAKRAPEKRSVIMFVLIRQSVMPARLAPEPIAQRWADLAPHYIQQAATAAGLDP